MNSLREGKLIPSAFIALSTLTPVVASSNERGYVPQDPQVIEISSKIQSLLDELGVGDNKDCQKAWNRVPEGFEEIITDPELRKYIIDETAQFNQGYLQTLLEDTNPETGKKGYLGDKFHATLESNLPDPSLVHVDVMYGAIAESGRVEQAEKIGDELAEAEHQCDDAMGYKPGFWGHQPDRAKDE